MKKHYFIVLCGLFIALQIVIGRYLAIDLGFLRISFIFIPIAIGGAVFGPMWNGLICVAADVAGFLLAPNQGPFFPGFTLSAFLTGYACGFFLDIRMPETWRTGSLSSLRPLIIRTFLAAFCVTILIDALLNTFWVAILYQKAYTFYLGTRIIKSSIMLPINVLLFGTIWRPLGRYVESAVLPKITDG